MKVILRLLQTVSPEVISCLKPFGVSCIAFAIIIESPMFYNLFMRLVFTFYLKPSIF